MNTNYYFLRGNGKLKKIFINGRFLCQRVTGVQRFAIEIVKKLDEIACGDIDFTIITPEEKYIITKLNLINIKIVNIKGKANYFWEQIKLPHYCKKNKCDDLLNLCNLAPVMYPGSCVIHDIGIIEAPDGFSFKQRFIYKLINKLNIKRYKHVFTVSNTMNKHISKYYKRNDIITVYSSYQHILQIEEKKPKIDLPDKYFFSLGSSNPNKNFKSIIRIAKIHPEYNIIISGGKSKNLAKEKLEDLSNVKFAGYLSDEEIVYLYKHCEAFLFPSLYEGFGLPPLEALACGCKCVICNDIPVLREIYKDNVLFVDFDNVNEINIKECNNLNLSYEWKESAVKIYNELI